MKLYIHLPIHLRGAVLRLTQDVFMAWYLVKHRDNFTLHYLLRGGDQQEEKHVHISVPRQGF
jgi:hypothetical protein